MIWLILIVLIGFFFWLANLGFMQFSRDWPLLLVLIGIINIINISKPNKRKLIINNLERGKITVDEAEKQLIQNKSR